MRASRGARQTNRVSVAAIAFAVLSVSLLLVDPPSSRAGGPAGALTATQLAADLRAGALTRTVPPNLTPPLARAWDAGGPAIALNGCTLKHGGVRIKRCVYGDINSHVSVVLFGDSHAAMWWPALVLISKQQHWRLIDMTKAGCPPVEVNIAAWFRTGAPYPECAQWRADAIAQIAALHPALVVVSWARFLEEPEARPLPGIARSEGSVWQDGVAAIFSSLHHDARHVLFISDIPTLGSSAPLCLSAHMRDVPACMPSRSAGTWLPAVKSEELALARHQHVSSIDPTSLFCTPTSCPVIVGDILVYRDNSHMTADWSRFIAPVLASSIVPIFPALAQRASAQQPLRGGRPTLPLRARPDPPTPKIPRLHQPKHD